MSRAPSVLFVRSLPADLRAEMVREWQEALRAIGETIDTVETSLDDDLGAVGDEAEDIEDQPDFDGLLKDLQELASLRARRDLFTELLALAEAMSAEERRD